MHNLPTDLSAHQKGDTVKVNGRTFVVEGAGPELVTLIGPRGAFYMMVQNQHSHYWSLIPSGGGARRKIDWVESFEVVQATSIAKEALALRKALRK